MENMMEEINLDYASFEDLCDYIADTRYYDFYDFYECYDEY